jgi:hypothetical protein
VQIQERRLLQCSGTKPSLLSASSHFGLRPQCKALQAWKAIDLTSSIPCTPTLGNKPLRRFFMAQGLRVSQRMITLVLTGCCLSGNQWPCIPIRFLLFATLQDSQHLSIQHLLLWGTLVRARSELQKYQIYIISWKTLFLLSILQASVRNELQPLNQATELYSSDIGLLIEQHLRLHRKPNQI